MHLVLRARNTGIRRKTQLNLWDSLLPNVSIPTHPYIVVSLFPASPIYPISHLLSNLSLPLHTYLSILFQPSLIHPFSTILLYLSIISSPTFHYPFLPPSYLFIPSIHSSPIYPSSLPHYHIHLHSRLGHMSSL